MQLASLGTRLAASVKITKKRRQKQSFATPSEKRYEYVVQTSAVPWLDSFFWT